MRNETKRNREEEKKRESRFIVRVQNGRNFFNRREKIKYNYKLNTNALWRMRVNLI